MFVTAVWMFIALNGYKIIIHVIKANSIINAYPSGYGFRVFIAPFFLLILQVFLWFKMFRWSHYPARIFAGIIGAYIWLMVIFVNLVIVDLYGSDYSYNQPLTFLWLYAYAGIGYLAYAFFGREKN